MKIFMHVQEKRTSCLWIISIGFGLEVRNHGNILFFSITSYLNPFTNLILNVNFRIELIRPNLSFYNDLKKK
jgi:hypothetical protein